MENFQQLSPAQNALLQDIFEQLPQEAGFHFQKALLRLAEPTSEYRVLYQIVSNLDESELESILEIMIEECELDRESFSTFCVAFPSLLSPESHEYLLSPFSEE